MPSEDDSEEGSEMDGSCSDDQSDAGGSVEMTVSVECSANESGTTWHHVKGL